MLRKKNDFLRSQGKSPAKGWGVMTNSGHGGINKSDIVSTSRIENTEFRKTQADAIGDKK